MFQFTGLPLSSILFQYAGCPIRKSVPLNGHVHLNTAYRSLSRPSSALAAQASSVCPFPLSDSYSSVTVVTLLPTIHFPLSSILKLVEISGFEPLTSALQGQRSPN